MLELIISFLVIKLLHSVGDLPPTKMHLVDDALANIHPQKLIAGCHPENKASMHVLKKVGFQFVGNKWFEDTQREEPCSELQVSLV